MREATSAAYRCWKKGRGRRMRCQKKSEESAKVSFFCHMVSTNIRIQPMMRLIRNMPIMAAQKFTIHSGCFMVRISSRNTWLNTGEASPGKIMHRPRMSTKAVAHLSSQSFSASALATL